MHFAQTRRNFVLASLGSLAACASPASPASREPARTAPPPLGGEQATLAAIERQVGGRLGVFARDLETGRELARRADERFAMCSTFKWVLVAQMLTQVDAGQLSLDERIRYTDADLLEYAPVTKAHLADGSLTLAELAHAAITVSDNTAANCETGKQRLRAGLPSNWAVGDKTGLGENGACNDVAIAIPEGRRPILIACYLSESSAGPAALGAAHAAVARAVVQRATA